MKLKIFISVFISILILTFSLLPVSAVSESPTTYRYYFYNNLNGEPVFDSVYFHACGGLYVAPMLQHPDYENLYYYESSSPL